MMIKIETKNINIESQNEIFNTFKKNLPEIKSNQNNIFFNLSPDMLCIVGFDGFIKKINSPFDAGLGFSEEELIATPFKDFIFQEDSLNNPNHLTQMKKGNFPANFENRFLCKDGTIKWLSWTSIVIPEERNIYAIAKDITKAKEIEFRLKKQTDSFKELITQKNEGLQYALLLQEALFHDPQTLNLVFPTSFIFHSAKDILSGDFYWFEKIANKAYLACADCTGHGVAGAMLSVLGINKLHEIIPVVESSPSLILDKLNTVIYKALGKKHSQKKMTDGMDIALYSIDFETNTLEYAGANNSLYIIRNGELIELKADKQSIGENLISKPFSNTVFQLMKHDMIYVFSDGFADQFGGSKGKKFTRKQLKNLLIQIANETMAIQKNILQQTLTAWKMDYEQTDDICIIGVKVM